MLDLFAYCTHFMGPEVYQLTDAAGRFRVLG